jgi:hypothetical protein
MTFYLFGIINVYMNGDVDGLLVNARRVFGENRQIVTNELGEFEK